MTLPKFSIRDKLFSHAYSTSNWFKPTYFEWDFANLHNDFIFLTDTNVFDVANPEFADRKKYAWLVESPAVTPQSYTFVRENSHLFDKIFTHSEYILQKPNTYLVPIGGCHLDEEEIGLKYEKTKLISMMYSHKNFSTGHGMRHNIAQRYSHLVDVMGSGADGRHLKKIHSCGDYAFSVVIENCKEGYYFTEKIVDCFLSGVVPIYWGTAHIGQFFNANGFLVFNDIMELEQIINSPTALAEFYNAHETEIVENYTKALHYKIGEDYLYTHYKEVI